MHPVFKTMYQKLLEQKRPCPKCKKEQIVLVKSKGEPARCKFCGAEMPQGK